jgi:NAD(P)-dependent dehydrogenase (short-subunit alcohol dehydrogenase family)
MAAQTDMGGKVVLVTGATNGIGQAAAVALARQGATVIVAGRSQARAEDVVRNITAQGGSAQAALGDLSLQADVRALAAQVLAKHDRLDVLLNNAGAIFDTRRESGDGIEMTFALNHLNYFLLTNLLLPLLKDTAARSGEARIVNVSSGAYQIARSGLNFDDLQGRERYSGWMAYGRSKLANILFTRELARRLEGTGVTANALAPGAVATGFAQNNSNLLSVLFRLVRPFMKSPEQGAQTLVYLASSPEVRGISGRYFENSRAKDLSSVALDEAAARRLWEVSEQMAGLNTGM